MASIFIIEEVRRRDGGQPERFEWTSASKPLGTVGGARACPLKPWPQPGEMRKVRTDYPGAKAPSFQVLGHVDKPHQFSGRWDDRYNYAGYATEEKRRFLALVKRGSVVRIQLGDDAYEGIIESYNLDRMRSWDIRYQFSIDVAGVVGETALTDRSPPTVLSAPQLFDSVDLATVALQEAQDGAPRYLATSAGADTEAAIADVTLRRDELAATLDQREILPQEKPSDAFVRLATQFRMVAASAFSAVAGLYEVRSDIDVGVRTAMSVLDFEDWSRSIRFTGRVLLGDALDSGNQVAERADPAPSRLYRPSEGESLYAISRRFYGTPHAWRLIADRNNLTEFELTGDELLIIPERGNG